MFPLKMRRLSLPLALTAALALTVPGWARPGDTRSYVILHSNDQHGHLLPFSYPDRVSARDDVAQMPVRHDIGGIARRATLVREIRGKNKNVYLFDAGDCMDGTPFSTEFLGKADYDAMNRVGYDYGIPGNHDFNMDATQFQSLTEMIRFPYLAANLYRKDGGTRPLPAYRISDWDGLKVAVFGLVTHDASTYKAAVQSYTLRSPLEEARELVPLLRKQADLVVMVSHIGLNEDREIARKVPGIDVVVGGHSHTRVAKGLYTLAENPGAGDPAGTIIVQAHQWVGELGKLNLTVTEGIDGRWRVTGYDESLVPVTGVYADHPEVARTVAGYWDKIKDRYGIVVGEAADDFSEVDGLDPTNYYLVADAIRETYGTEFEIENFGGVRAPILKGKVTMGDLVTVDPFGNTITTFKIKGADLKKLIRETRPATSATLRYSLRRAVSPETGKPVWSLLSATMDGKPIEDERVYTGATTSYYFSRSVKPYATDVVETKRSRVDVLAEYFRKHSPVAPRADGRLNFNGASVYD